MNYNQNRRTEINALEVVMNDLEGRINYIINSKNTPRETESLLILRRTYLETKKRYNLLLQNEKHQR